MRNQIVVFIVCVLFVFEAKAQNSCSEFYPFKEGTEFQMTSYDKKDKPTAVIDYVVKESTSKTTLLSYEIYDEKGELVLSSEYGMTCEEDGISIDFKSLVAPGVFEQYKDMEIDITGTNILLPNNLSAGQTLPDADMLMEVKMNPIVLKLNAKVFNRKVEGKETITTTAGTFECFVISYSNESKMGIKFRGTGKQWLAKGVGMVKQIDYNKKGQVVSKSVLTKFKIN